MFFPWVIQVAEKKLYRSGNKILGGVCSGIAEYYGWDPTMVRLAWAFITLFAGAGILFYAVAWIVMPKNPSSK